ncbi:inositol monophosphatase family protein [Kribbella turkmenica]|uniref:Inositol monophosphatase family protein n=1 Tax=Kribbella turkmenica TaxID=2530375 RepID=A0A4R4WYR7_9ACTN|nr:inositol monophosphatase family protein [Kribbella turkmenica]TDD22915.1 inositol monophosphatase family protein [Kribbella turkmenica]
MNTLTDAEVAIRAVEAGAAVVRATFGTAVNRFAKSATDFATEADLASERAILEVIGSLRPGDAVIGEEYGAIGQAARTWLVDPLCGTVNFAARSPMFAVNVALPDSGTTVAAVAQPLTGEVFWTDGTAVNVRRDGTDSPATCSATSRLVDVDIDATPGEDFLGAQLLTDEAFRAAFALRVCSTALTLAWVAVGRHAGYLTNGPLVDSVHFTAGTALCQAAGGVVTDFRGDPLHTGPGLVAAADATTHRRLLELIAPHLDGAVSGTRGGSSGD